MANQHFFKPLLPGFHSHLTIPEAFYLKYVQGRNEQTVAKLRSDASKITWEVKVEEDGQTLTDGWKDFALAHDLRIGDIVVFRQERHMDFHLTLFGPSCCEIQYGSCLDNERNLWKILRKKKVMKSPRRERESCFVANVMASTLRYDRLNLPRGFVRANGLDKKCGEIVLMNEKGRSWTLDLTRNKSYQNSYIKRGWRSFCHANGLRAGGFFTFKLIQRGGTPVLLLLSEEPEDEECSEGDEIESLSMESESNEESKQDEKSFKKRSRSIWKASSSPSQNRFVTLALTPYNINKYRMFLPVPFTRMHGINEETKMALLDKNGVNWSTNLRSERSRIKLVGGCKDFFKANCVKTGESVKLELIWKEDTSCVLKFCSIVKPKNK
ncbi:unnamed protein product [Arabis nemorensis]|uniref:TF-B3 domain-containing protein n=1 Tax=Arabis nemorensis TaxID=586526 RepID=A0A565C5F4_9BRAS|nr:unnamed protein product [Arabis nemorensis]